MKVRKPFDFERLAISVALLSFLAWFESGNLKIFQADRPGADVWAFMVARGPLYSFVTLAGVAIVGFGMWLGRLPETDADGTEFHEKETD